MQMHLKVANGAQAGKLIAINHDKFLIGRSDDCHLRPKSESISRRHCAIIRKDGKILLMDLKSRNGTIVNDKKLDPAKAKILKDGDHICVGKLEFIAVIEAGIANVKKPEVKDVKDAAERAAGADSRYEEVDISSWLDEADQIERRDPETRQFTISSTINENDQSTIMEIKGEQETKTDVPAQKGKPGKLPPVNAKTAQNSKDAASETLRKFFSGR